LAKCLKRHSNYSKNKNKNATSVVKTKARINKKANKYPKTRNNYIFKRWL
jgi:hypothetical protein